MTEATTDRKLEYALVQSSIDRISAEVHYRFVGDIGDTIESFSEWDAACARYRELYAQYKVTDKPLPLSPFTPPYAMGVFNFDAALSTARIDGARALFEWIWENAKIEMREPRTDAEQNELSIDVAWNRWLAEKEGK